MVEKENFTNEARFMSDENYLFFNDNLNALAEQHPEKFIAIKNKTVIGSYASFYEAYRETVKTEELGTFLIQWCSTSEDDNLDYFANNNIMFTR